MGGNTKRHSGVRIVNTAKDVSFPVSSLYTSLLGLNISQLENTAETITGDNEGAGTRAVEEGDRKKLVTVY